MKRSDIKAGVYIRLKRQPDSQVHQILAVVNEAEIRKVMTYLTHHD